MFAASMNRMFQVGTSVCLLAAAGAIQADTIALTHGNRILDRPGYQTTNWTNSPTYVGYSTDDGPNWFRTLFDVPMDGVTQTVASATLNLYIDFGGAQGFGQTIDVTIYAAASDWTDGQVSWNNAAIGTPWTTPGGDLNLAVTATMTLPAAANDNSHVGWYTADVTSIINYFYNNPGQNFGLILVPTSSLGGYRAIASTTDADPEHRPFIEFTVPEPATMGLSGAAAMMIVRRRQSR